MKKLYYLLLLALPVFFAVSCDDDESLPDVDVAIKISGAVKIDQNLYVVQGDTLAVDSIGVVNRQQGKAAIITSAAYMFDYIYVGTSVVPPYGAEFNTATLPVGNHLLQIECPLYAVDKSPATLYFAYKVIVVASEDDLPSGEQQTLFVDKPGIKEN